jgi:glucose-fructose oxidoreductase
MKADPIHSRRNFLQQATLGVGASLLAAPAFASHSLFTPPQTGKPLGIALMGLGYYSRDLLAPALQETKNCRLTGIVTGTPAKADEWKKKYNIPAKNVYNYQNFDRIADNPDIDIVYVVLPNSMHAEYVTRAAKAGKHVICEKPMAMSVRECEQMIEACKKADKELSIGYRMQFEPTTQEIMRIGQQKELGQVQMVAAGAGFVDNTPGRWRHKKVFGGGAMMDMGVYALQGARYVTGEEPIAVTAQTFTTRPEMFKEVDETTTFQLLFPSGAVANLHTSFGMSMNYLHATAEKGWFRLDPFSTYSNIKGESSKGPLQFPKINQQAAQMDEVAYCIANKKPMRVTGEEGLKDMRVVEAIYQSIKNGSKRIELKA